MSSKSLSVVEPQPNETTNAQQSSAAAANHSTENNSSSAATALDFITSSYAIKDLFSLSVVDRPVSVAVHHVNGTLLMDADDGLTEYVDENAAENSTKLPENESDERSLVALSSLELDSEALDLVHAMIQSNRQQEMVRTSQKEPREYLQWQFQDLTLLVGSNALVHRNASSQALTVRVEDARHLQRLLAQHEQMKANKASYADVTKRLEQQRLLQLGQEEKLNVGQSSANDCELQEVCLQTCLIASPTFSAGSLLSSGLGSLQPVDASDSSATSETVPSAPIATVLDIYLDNIMANVPQLALCLEDKGFIQSVKLLRTAEIPSGLLTSSTLDTSTLFDVIENATGETIFSPTAMETNAASLLRFLKTNCTRDNTTYLLRREKGQSNIQLYDISTISSRGQLKWIWWLAMMSYRFANRLRHVSLHARADQFLRRSCRARQRSLLRNTLDLLETLEDMDGNRHESLVAAVSENLADTFLSVEEDENGNEQTREAPMNQPPAASGLLSQQQYMAISGDALGKAQDHLAYAIKFLMPVLQSHLNKTKKCNDPTKSNVAASFEQEVVTCDTTDDVDCLGEDGRQADSSLRRRIEPVATQLFGLYYKYVNVSLRLAEIHLSNYFSSSAMQALRSSARKVTDSIHLLQLMGNSKPDWWQMVQLQYTALWNTCSNFARSFAADELWRDRGHASGDDVISVLREAESAFTNNETVLDTKDPLILRRFVNPENPLSKRSEGSVNLHSLSGVVGFKAPLGKKKGVISRTKSTGLTSACEVLNEQRLILKDQRRVLVAACLCYFKAIQSYRHIVVNKGGPVDNVQAESESAWIGLLQQRLGDACNETGKIILTELRLLLTSRTTTSNGASQSDTGAAEVLLGSAQFWFFEGLAAFTECKDLRNLALLRCNLCQTYKLQANSIFALDAVKSEDVPTHAENCLLEAANQLQAAHESFGARDADPVCWDMVSEELAATFLVLGVRRRQSLIGSGSLPFIMQTLRLSPGKEHSIIDPMLRSLTIYDQLGNWHQAAATHYQLALFYTKTWTVQINEAKTREKLSCAFMHFNAAHAFFTKAARGNEVTLCLLCLDSANLYAAVPGEDCALKALLRCLDTIDAFSLESINRVLNDTKGRDDWFDTMDKLAVSIDVRVFKLLRNLVALEEEGKSSRPKGHYKDIYRAGLKAKLTPASASLASGNEKFDQQGERMGSLHGVLLALSRQNYDGLESSV
jgi:hypothetical protein